ncbi:MAG: lactate utilization protein [Cohaesibacter sp.]|nr:lactate utilization protein [Cohaesibacter sp.]
MSTNPVKAAILGKIRQSLKTTGDRSIEREEVELRLATKERGIMPKRGKVDAEARVSLFLHYNQAVASTTDRIADYDALPEAISDYLRGRNLPQRLRMGQDKRLIAASWDKVPSLETSIGPSDGSDLVGLSHALGGVAETGTAIFTSGRDNPTTLNFLPETHIIVVDAKDIASDYESVLDRLRNDVGDAQMPRVVNMITGPSRSGDIEQTILLGAHGPKFVHVIVVG